MEDSVDLLIDLNGSVVNSQTTSLLPQVSTCSKNNAMIGPLIAFSPPFDNNPFDFVIHQMEIKEADKNDPFEMAFENAYGCKEEKKDSDAAPPNVEKDVAVPAESHSLEKMVSDTSETVGRSENELKKNITEQEVLDEINLDDVQPPDSLLNLSLELSGNCSNITISDTLHLSDMSDIRFSPGGEMGKFCGKGNALSKKWGADSNFPADGQIIKKSSAQELEEFLETALSSDKSGSFQESPIKVFCELKSEESVKALIENRIQKCIAKALNDSHQQLRNVTLSEHNSSAALQTSLRLPRQSLRASISVPQNLHLLQDANDIQPKISERYSLLPFHADEKISEDLQIPFLDLSLSSKNPHKVLDTPAKQPVVMGNPILTTCENIQLESDPASARVDGKKFDLPDVFIPNMDRNQCAGISPRRSFHKTSGPELKNHRRSLSCEVIPSQQATKLTSPPKMPPLPLSSETIRDLSLSSKHSPPKQQQPSRPSGDFPAKVNRPVPMPAYAQPKLVLRKKATASGGSGLDVSVGLSLRTGRGPMKATLPVQNMTKCLGSPRSLIQSQNRKTAGPSRRQTLAESPGFQKTKLCPLAASTPSNVEGTSIRANLINAEAQQPRRILASGIPSPSRKGIKMMSAASHLLPTSGQTVQNTLRSGMKPDTPTRGLSPTLQTRVTPGNSRVLQDRNNGFSSPPVTPVRKLGAHFGARLTNNRLSEMGKENMAHPRR